MAETMRAIDLLVRRIVPEDLRDRLNTYSAKEVNDFLLELHRKYPDKYTDISHKLAQLGLQTSYLSGSSLGYQDMEPVLDREHIFGKMDQEVDELRHEYRNDPEEFQRQREKVWLKYNDLILKTTMTSANKQHNAMSMAVASGARGKPQQIQAMLSTPGLYQDHNQRVIPIFVRNSFAEGLRPMEFMAGTFGARASVVSTKKCYSLNNSVLYADGTTKSITNVQVGDIVLGSNTEGQTFPTKVIALHDQGLQEVNRYTFRFGMSNQYYTVDCTEDHKLLINDRRYYSQYNSRRTRKVAEVLTKKEISNLWHKRTVEPLGKASTNVFATFPTDYIGQDSGVEVPEALFLGLVTGDGCATSKRAQVGFSCNDKVLIEQMKPYLETIRIGIHQHTSPAAGGDDSIQFSFNDLDYTPSKLAAHLNEKGSADFKAKGFFSSPKRILDKHGLMGKYAQEKKLPPDIWDWDRKSVAQYIAGLIITDGSIYKTKQNQSFVSFYATSEELVRGLFDLLEKKFHIYSSEIKARTVGGFSSSTEKRKFPLYGSVIAGYSSLAKFDQWVAPHLLGVKKEKWRELFAGYELSQENPYRKARLVKTEHLGLLPCMDLEVEHQDHLFVLGNGIIGSNSTAQGGDIGKLFGQATSRLVITDKDCGVKNGLSYSLENEVLPGRVLAYPAGDYKAGTILDRNAIAALHKSGVKNVIARSPLTCKADGLCARCTGIMMDSDSLPRVGDHVGATAAQASCLHEDTRILLSDGNSKPIKDIEVNDEVLGVDENGVIKPSLVLGNLYRGVQECNEYDYRLGGHDGGKSGKLIATENHRCVVSSVDRKRPDDSISRLTPLRGVKLPGSAGYRSQDEFTFVSEFDDAGMRKEPAAFTIGLLLGDGTTATGSKNAGMYFACFDDQLHNDLLPYLKAHFNCGLTKTGGADSVGSYRISDLDGGRASVGVIEGKSIRNRLKYSCVKAGIWGMRRTDKQLPSDVHTWDNESVYAALAGLLVTDGFVALKGTVIGFTNTSKRLQDQIYHLLKTRCGVSHVTVGSSIKKGYTLPCYSYSVGGARNALSLGRKLLPYMLGEKRAKLEELIQRCERRIDDSKSPVTPVIGRKIQNILPHGKARTYDLWIDHPNHVFLTSDYIQVHNSEPLTQAALGAKHTAGQAKGRVAYGGLDTVSQFVQSPAEYQHRASVARISGRVEQITDAPQGGKIIRVQGEDHYVPQGYESMVDVGDDLDEGDQMSEGLMDVRDVVQHKGLGEGRKYYAERLGEIYKDSGLTSHPKNLEIVARGALNTVTMDDYMDGLDALPDDAVEYNRVVGAWTPENEQRQAPDNSARNQYLSRDTLHYTAGTKLNRQQLKTMRDAGIEQIHTVHEKPPFTANMDRLRTASHYNDDWLASMSSSYLKKQLTEGAVRGSETNVHENRHWAPRIAYGKGFGEDIRETGKF